MILATHRPVHPTGRKCTGPPSHIVPGCRCLTVFELIEQCRAESNDRPRQGWAKFNEGDFSAAVALADMVIVNYGLHYHFSVTRRALQSPSAMGVLSLLR